MTRQRLARWGRWLVLGLSITLAGASITSSDGFVLHDDFNQATRMSPHHWFGSETRRPHSILEAHRFVLNDKLYLSVAGYGGEGSNSGRRTGSFGLGLRTLRPITALQAELIVVQAHAQGCAANALSTQGRAQMVGFFFNDGGSSGKGDLTGDVVAVLEKVADSKAGHFIRALVLRCTSWSCHKGESIKALLFKRHWTLHEPDVLRIEWTPQASRFAFTVNPGAKGQETRRIAYDKAKGPVKPLGQQRQRLRLRLRHHGANCRSGRRSALMTVSVDDVHLRFPDAKTSAALSSQALPPAAAAGGAMTSPSYGEFGQSEWE